MTIVRRTILGLGSVIGFGWLWGVKKAQAISGEEWVLEITIQDIRSYYDLGYLRVSRPVLWKETWTISWNSRDGINTLLAAVLKMNRRFRLLQEKLAEEHLDFRAGKGNSISMRLTAWRGPEGRDRVDAGLVSGDHYTSKWYVSRNTDHFMVDSNGDFATIRRRDPYSFNLCFGSFC